MRDGKLRCLLAQFHGFALALRCLRYDEGAALTVTLWCCGLLWAWSGFLCRMAGSSRDLDYFKYHCYRHYYRDL